MLIPAFNLAVVCKLQCREMKCAMKSFAIIRLHLLDLYIIFSSKIGRRPLTWGKSLSQYSRWVKNN